ncbi:MAG TPA: hypothetical protein VIJ34_09875, partial [Acidimicrobiales bacterium]
IRGREPTVGEQAGSFNDRGAPEKGILGAARRRGRSAKESSYLSSHLDDLVLDLLHEAVRSNAGKRPEIERRATRARHAIERATIALRGAAGSEEIAET